MHTSVLHWPTFAILFQYVAAANCALQDDYHESSKHLEDADKLLDFVEVSLLATSVSFNGFGQQLPCPSANLLRLLTGVIQCFWFCLCLHDPHILARHK